MFSILLVIVSIIWAYFTDALPRTCYNEFDYFILGRKPRNEDGQRVRSFQSFILAMSDQQLVSGLALVIAINVIRNGVQDLDAKLSVYAYTNAVILAFFSCIVHLATMAVLQDYLKDRGLLKHVRVAIMICVFALLLQSLGESWTMENTVTVRCAVENNKFLNDYSGPVSMTDRLGDISAVFGIIILFGILGFGYVRRILELYLWGPRDFPRKWQTILLAKMTGRFALEETEILAAKQRFVDKERGRLIRLLALIVPDSFTGSFMFEILWLIFYFAFGLAQVVFYLTSTDTGRPAISFEPRFGQLLPLVLLTLPFLAMLEGYSGEVPVSSFVPEKLLTQSRPQIF